MAKYTRCITALILIALATCGLIGASAQAGGLDVVWGGQGGERPLKSFSSEELSHLKTRSSREKDLASGKVANWRGVLISDVIDKSLDQLPLDQRAQVDLVVVKNGSGAQALIPRSVITKYPLLLALNKASETEALVIPWTTHSKIREESLPLETFWVTAPTRVELTSYRERYGSVLLKRRKDPSAMRGEKIFVQSCVACHSAGQSTAQARTIAFDGGGVKASHPAVKGFPNFTDRDRRSVALYLDAYRAENPPAPIQKTQK